MLESKDIAVQTCIRQVPVTYERLPYDPSSEENAILKNPGTARANLAPSLECPHGTQSSGWADKHSGHTVLQQHCAYFDPDGDNIVWPHDTYHGFEDMFAKYGDKDGLGKWDILELMSGQRVLFDLFGTCGALSRLSLYLLLWPADGIVRKEDLRRVYDGSIFSELSLRRSGKAKAV
ncbi:uncharacterized protein B0H18DRAFT_1082258 [Fomitopsis serialis]|uniref:uncharacterized protein n=1 Tax=Fomitopsis serialis TaxID=139415 RepID=UPI00200868C0|nr:uncharacterized protein B0H18DRAFT_1082258 [Neoantrodia serialis]KAH9935510.1 hypothetical protein B0H18DRAFT_1082258 [Neoantrodia serialis]